MPERFSSLPDAHTWIVELNTFESLRRRRVRLWLVSLDLTDTVLADLRTLLAADELQRAGRFLIESARRRFIASRAATRLVVGHLVGADPKAIHFACTEKGKPFLSVATQPSSFRFNVSHSGDLALIVTAATCEVGVDLEMIQDRPDLHQAASTFFAPPEQALLNRLPAAERTLAFYRIWTLKEAVLKAAGQGITSGLREPDVSAAVTARPSSDGCSVRCAGALWHIYGFEPASGAEAALAVEEA